MKHTIYIGLFALVLSSCGSKYEMTNMLPETIEVTSYIESGQFRPDSCEGRLDRLIKQKPLFLNENYENRLHDKLIKWSADFFHNGNPLVLELACGKGEYTVEMAQAYPDKNFIGVDLKGNRIWTGARKALDLALPNAAFVRTRIEYLPHFFAVGEVSEIWITFPDPYLKRSKTSKRLTSPFFLEKYRQFCKTDGFVHLKTDDPTLFEFSREVAAAAPCSIAEVIEDVYKNGEPPLPLCIKTYYEKMHLEDKRTIRYLKFRIHPHA